MAALLPKAPGLTSNGENKLACGLARFDAPVHLGRVRHRKDAGDRDLQPAVEDAANNIREAVFPGLRIRIDMANM